MVIDPGSLPVEPDSDQTLLLRAILAGGPESLEAWSEWRNMTDFQALDHSSQWLIPMLYRCLSNQGVAEKELLEYRSVFRHVWYKNLLMLRWLRSIASDLQQQRVAYCCYGAAALSLASYQDFGVRPIGALNLLLSEEDLTDLAGTLQKHGCAGDASSGIYRDTLGRLIQLKWVSALELQGAIATDEIADFGGEKISLLNRKIHGYDILAKHQSWDHQSSLLWITDFVSLYQSADVRSHFLSHDPTYTSHVQLIDRITNQSV